MFLCRPVQGEEEEPKVVWWHNHDRELRPGFQLGLCGPGPVSLTGPQHPFYRLKKLEEITSKFCSNTGLSIFMPTGDNANKNITESIKSLRRETCDNEVGQGFCEEPKKYRFQETMPL